MSTIQNLRKSLVRNWKPACSLIGDAVSGTEFAPFPSPCLLPPAGDGLVCSQLALLQNCSVLPLFLHNAARSSPFNPHLLVADASVWGTFLLGVAFRLVICGFYLFFLLVRLPSKIWKLPPDPPVRGFPGVWKLPLLQLPSWDKSPSLTLLSLFYLLYFVLPPFEDNGLLFWVSDVLCWRSEVVLCSLLSVQLFFRRICRGESGLPVLFLLHLSSSDRQVLYHWTTREGSGIQYLEEGGLKNKCIRAFS